MSDIPGELRDLAIAVGELVDELADTMQRLESACRIEDDLREQIADLENEVAFAEARDSDSVYELIADFKRGLLSVDELLERTVGR